MKMKNAIIPRCAGEVPRVAGRKCEDEYCLYGQYKEHEVLRTLRLTMPNPHDTTGATMFLAPASLKIVDV
jgi:hypothetical protein